MQLNEVLHLIDSLYDPRCPNVNQVQQSLQELQKSENGLFLGNELLNNLDFNTNVHYFGALTLAVQASLSESINFSNIGELLRLNLYHLTRYCHFYIKYPEQINSSNIVITKLMSNLSLLFTEINTQHLEAISQWNNPVNTLILLLNGSSQELENWNNSHTDNNWINIINNSINGSVSYEQLMQFIATSPKKNEILLTFLEIIVEDLTKLQTRKHSMGEVYHIVHQHLYISAMALLNANLTSSELNDILFKTISAWITYVSMTKNLNGTNLDLSELLANLINCMCHSNEQTDQFIVAEKVISILGTIFAVDPVLLSFDLRAKLEVLFLGVSRFGLDDTFNGNQWFLQYMNHLVTNEMTTELKDLSTCIVDFLMINTLDVANKLFTNKFQNDNRGDPVEISQKYIKVLLQLTNFPLLPVLQESFSSRMVDFWLDLSEAFINLLNEDLTPNATRIAIDIFQQVINIYLPKISLDNKQKIIEEDENDESLLNEFEDFRDAVSDLTQSLWSILGNQYLTDVLIAGIGSSDGSVIEVNNMEYSSFYQIEAMSFLLNKLLLDMNLSESPWIVNILAKNNYFIKNIILLLKTGLQINVTNSVSTNLKIDFIKISSTLIGTISGYFTNVPTDLNLCIEVLFQSLESFETQKNKVSEKLDIMIVKTINILCDTCRNQLSPYLLHFYGVFDNLLKPESHVATFTKSKLARSIGYIVECNINEGPEEQGKYIDHFLNLITGYIDQCLAIPQPNEFQIDYLHNLLNCVSEFGSALIHPEEMEESELLLQNLPRFQEYWMIDPLQCRAKVMNLIEKILNNQVYGKIPSFMEVSCLLLGKTLSLPDNEPHFLKYSMSDILNFIMHYIDSSTLGSFLQFFAYLLEKLISHYKDQLKVDEYEFIFNKVFVQYYDSHIANDPDLLQSMINFIITILDSKPSLVINSPSWTNFVLPTFVKLLPSHEKFTIFAITKFWTKVVNNRKYTREDLEFTRQQIIAMGPELVYQTMFGLYHTQRSDLNSYTDLVRTLVAKFPVEMKGWLQAVLPQLSDKTATHEKFINKLLVSRGSRVAGNVILNWWLECTSLPNY